MTKHDQRPHIPANQDGVFSRTPPANQVLPDPDACHVFCFIDALGAAISEHASAIRDLAPHWRPLKSVFGYSSACVPSIISGRYPEDHLHWNFFTRAEDRIKVPGWLQAMPGFIRDRGRVRRHLSKRVAKHNNFSGYFQMYQMPIKDLGEFAYCETRDPFGPTGLNRGGTIFTEMQQRQVPFWCSDPTKPSSANWAALDEAVTNPDRKFHFIYDADLDGWLHQHGKHHPDLPEQLAGIADRVAAVKATARNHHPKVVLHLFSDHGMCPIHECYNMFNVLERSRLRMNRDYHCVIDSTMIRTWYRDESSKREIRELLDRVPVLDRLTPAYLKAVHCTFPDNRFGDDVWLANPHVLLCPSHLGRSPMAGMHGYSLDHEDSHATYLSDDPSEQPQSIVDIHTCMRRAAGLATYDLTKLVGQAA